MRYWEAKVRTAREAGEAVAELMTRLAGGVAVDDPATLQQGKARGDWDYCDLPEGDPAFLTVTAYFPATEEGEAGAAASSVAAVPGPASPADAASPLSPAESAAVAELRRGLSAIRSLGLGPVDEPVLGLVNEEDWANAWKAYFHPFRVGRRLVVVPSWEDYIESPGDIRLTLDPGMAFGTGTHPTTSLCLEVLEEAVRSGDRILDVGCGSGILAIAAAKLGAESVEAMDIDPVAVQVAEENVARNGVSGSVRLARGELAAVVPPGKPSADIVVSNIIADVIIALVGDVRARLRPGGLWLAGGIIEERLPQVEEALRRGGFELAGCRLKGGWAVLEARL
ncbi:MAG: 50S ribosomal protein L11 methyltransferase [Bacillota bacterium]